MDLHPTYGTAFSVTRDPYDFLAMSHAIFTAYSALEDLDLKVEGEAKSASGQWHPQQLARRRV